MGYKQPPTLPEYLARCYYNPETGCLSWLGATTGFGYAVAKREQKTVFLHKFVYEQEHGPVPKGYVVTHTCPNPECLEITHLKAVIDKRYATIVVAKPTLTLPPLRIY